ncbi:unnamed protein product [Symbiodinium pilosum]|uniref:Uncharacterized protein n=1 Tax=Symbiodinium pilosum TaxID=2952 RepID=A0A812S1I4_SYMPI|nr:unnamed protein product [Symbiodinium pilosum]
MERHRFEGDLKQIKDAIAKMNGRLNDIEAGGDRQLVGDLETEMGHMIEALREVEAGFENAYSQHSQQVSKGSSAKVAAPHGAAPHGAAAHGADANGTISV